MIDARTDEALLGRYRARGDVRAFEVLVRRHRRALFAFILRFIGDPHKAEDLLQEVFVRLATRAADFEGRASVRTWLFTIARNQALDELRKARHRATISLDGSSDAEGGAMPLVERISSEDPSPDKALCCSRLQPVLVAAISSLPDEQREVFLLREYAGVPFKEIAQITGVGLNTVKSRMRYALEALRRTIVEAGLEEELLEGREAPEEREASQEAVGT